MEQIPRFPNFRGTFFKEFYPHAFNEMNVKLLREKTGLSQQELANATGIPKDRIAKWEQGKGSPKAEDSITLDNFFKDFVPRGKNGAPQTIRKPKIDTNPETDGITFIPISAQAGYSKRIIEPMFRTSLQKIFIPGLPYRGEHYRIWEVEGNSMEPTFKEHFYVLTEQVEQQYWHQAKDYYAYVIVTIDSVLIKRIFKKSSKEWILISDNETLYPQFTMSVNEVKELWFIKRKMDWEMSPPKKVEIKI